MTARPTGRRPRLSRLARSRNQNC